MTKKAAWWILQTLKANLVLQTKQLNRCHVILVSSDFGFLNFMEEPPTGKDMCRRMSGLRDCLGIRRNLQPAPLGHGDPPSVTCDH